MSGSFLFTGKLFYRVSLQQIHPMPFQPSIKVILIPRTSDYFVVEDTSGEYDETTNPNGFGGPYAPANLAALSKILVLMKPYAEESAQIPDDSISGNLTSGLTCISPVSDG